MRIIIIIIKARKSDNYAKLCDSKADQAKKDEIVNAIEQKYATKFEQMYIDLMDDGKAFAKENNLNVNWGN